VVNAGEVRNTLLEYEMGLRSNSSAAGGSIRKITPVTTATHHQRQQQNVAETKQLPLQVYSLLFYVQLSYESS